MSIGEVTNVKRNDLTDKIFGRLKVLKYSHTKNGKAYWLCKCECGNLKTIVSYSLLSGNTISCGCYRKENSKTMNTIHGFSRRIGSHHLKNIHKGMLDRCNNPKSSMYKYYGEKGIKVCKAWQSLKNFGEWALSNGFDENKQIDRIDNSKGYYPENCRFVDKIINANNKTNTKYVTINNETLPLCIAARKYGVKPWTIRNRLKAGYKDYDLVRKVNFSGYKVNNDVRANN